MLDDSVKKKKENEKIEIRRETRLGTRRKRLICYRGKLFDLATLDKLIMETF